jgi:hypothetical protein
MGLIGSLVPQEIPVGPGTAQKGITLGRTFTHREGHSLFGELRFYGSHYTCKPFIALHRVFTALQYKGVEPESRGLTATIEYLLHVKPVTCRNAVPATQTAITAVVTAVGTYLDKSTDIDTFAKTGLNHLTGTNGKIFPILFVKREEKRLPDLILYNILSRKQ